MTLMARGASPSRRARRWRTPGSELLGGVISRATVKLPAARESARDMPLAWQAKREEGRGKREEGRGAVLGDWNGEHEPLAYAPGSDSVSLAEGALGAAEAGVEEVAEG